MWLLTCYHQPLHPLSHPVLPSFLPFCHSLGKLNCTSFISVFTCLDWHIMHFSQKNSRAFQDFFVMRKETEEPSLMERTWGFSLQKNNWCCKLLSLWCADVGVREGSGSLECSSVHLPCVCSEVRRKLVFEPQTHFIFKCFYMYNQHGFVERNKVCGVVSSPQIQPCTCVCTLKANLSSLTCGILYF